MLRFVDSFNHYASANRLTKWTGDSSSGGAISITSGGRFSTNCFQTTTTNNSNGSYMFKTIDNQQTWIIGVAYKINQLDPSANQPAIIAIRDAGSLQCDLRVKPDGTLNATRNGTSLGTTSFALAAGTFYYIEFKVKIHSSTGTVDVRVDGTSRLSLTGQNTQQTANATANQIYIGHVTQTVQPTNSTTHTFSDLYVCDSQGSANNDLLGDMRIEAIFPSGAGNSTVWTPSAGSNYQCVDESAPNGDTDYVSSATPGDIDLYAYNDVTPTTANVKGVQTCIYARKDDAGTRTIKPEIRSGGSNFAGTNVNISTSYLYYLEIFETDPNTATTWTLSNVNAAEFGVNEVA